MKPRFCYLDNFCSYVMQWKCEEFQDFTGDSQDLFYKAIFWSTNKALSISKETYAFIFKLFNEYVSPTQ